MELFNICNGQAKKSTVNLKFSLQNFYFSKQMFFNSHFFINKFSFKFR